MSKIALLIPIWWDDLVLGLFFWLKITNWLLISDLKRVPKRDKFFIFEQEVLEFLILEFTNFTENLLSSKWLTEKKVSYIFQIPLA